MRRENAVVFSSQAVVLLRIHSEHPPALFEIETPALFEIETLPSADAVSGISDHYRPALLLRRATLPGSPAPSACGQSRVPLPWLSNAPNSRERSKDDYYATPSASGIRPG